MSFDLDEANNATRKNPGDGAESVFGSDVANGRLRQRQLGVRSLVTYAVSMSPVRGSQKLWSPMGQKNWDGGSPRDAPTFGVGKKSLHELALFEGRNRRRKSDSHEESCKRL